MLFPYFRDPDNFAYHLAEAAPCSLCSAPGLWFSAGGFYGRETIDCICDTCLAAGKLKALGIETNDAMEGSQEEIDIIVYATPALPTWQDRVWPRIDGRFCVFERFASREDFVDKAEFIASFGDRYPGSDLDWLWEILPAKRLTHHRQGGDVTVYLFTNNGAKHCTWDAN